MIGTLPDETGAKRFGDFLTAQGMANDVEASGGAWAIWVHDENHLEPAEKELARFQKNPDDARYVDASKAAAAVRKEQAEDERRYKKQQINVRGRWSQRARGKRPVTLVMIVACLIVAAATAIGANRNEVMDALAFGESPTRAELAELIRTRAAEAGLEAPSDEEIQAEIGSLTRRDLRERYGITGFERIAQGQVWRLFTTMFIHYGFIHLLFNLFWLYDLGGQIETTKGTLRFVVLVLLSEGLSSVAQNLASGPGAGGMSGVIYALFGYIWMKQRFEPAEGLWLAPNTVLILLAWLVICMTGVIGPVGNTSHVVGLGVGLAAGAGPSLWIRLRRMRSKRP